jgi:hypothetical protein
MMKICNISYLNQKEAQEIDAELMGTTYGYTLAQVRASLFKKKVIHSQHQ